MLAINRVAFLNFSGKIFHVELSKSGVVVLIRGVITNFGDRAWC